MFQHRGRLPHLLAPSAYSGGAHARELEHVFRGAWHPVATQEDLPRVGSFVTTEVLGTPLLVWRDAKGPHAFVNVCAHRHAIVASAPRGCSERLRCPYHGWQYDAQGYCVNIPEPEGVGNPHPKELRLMPVRLERCGSLLFVALGTGAPSLAEWLGPLFGELERRIGAGFRTVDLWSDEHACDWKVPIENALESYHLPSVHSAPFSVAPEPSEIEHVLAPGYTSFRVPFPGRLASWLRREPRHDYQHLHVFPSLTVALGDLFAAVHDTTPLGPRRSRMVTRVFAHRGEGSAVARALLGPFVAWRVRRMARRIGGEDAAVYGGVQRGLEHSSQAGALSAREERVWAFQQWVAGRLAVGGSGPEA